VQEVDRAGLEEVGLDHDLLLHGDGGPEVRWLEVGFVALEGGGHDTDDAEGIAVDGDVAAEDVGVRGELLLPVMLADDRDRAAAGGFGIGGQDGAAKDGICSEGGEVVACDEARGDLNGGAGGIAGGRIADAYLRGKAAIGGYRLEWAGDGLELAGEVVGEHVEDAEVDAAEDAAADGGSEGD